MDTFRITRNKVFLRTHGQHQHDLDSTVRVLCKLPQAGELILSKLVPVTLVGMLILVPVQIHKLGVILVADIVFYGVGVQLVE